MDTSKPQMQSLLDLDSDILTLCEPILNMFLSQREADQSEPWAIPEVDDEIGVRDNWVSHFAKPALSLLGHLFWPAKIGTWRGAVVPAYLFEGDLPSDFVPTPDYTFTLYLQTTLQSSPSTAPVTFSKPKSVPLKSTKTGKEDCNKTNPN